MKTIKELEGNIIHPNMPITTAKIQTLKDVLELIDELKKSHGLTWNEVQELKKRITG